MFHVVGTDEWFFEMVPVGDAPPMTRDQVEAAIHDGTIFHCGCDDVREVQIGDGVYRVHITTDGGWLEVTELSNGNVAQ